MRRGDRGYGYRGETLEVFDLASPAAIDTYKQQLELGCRLGGTMALAINYSNLDPAAPRDIRGNGRRVRSFREP